jgi:hypothetical protein
MTTRLSADAFLASCRFIETHARALEIARLRRHFGGGPWQAVAESLRAYQNPDGGFGQALEPDLRTPESSALCTSIAFQTLRTMPHKADDIAAAGIRYLIATFEPTTAHWRIIPRSAESSAHAPWWNQTGREAVLDAFSLNPTAELVGYLCDYEQWVPDAVRSRAMAKVLARIEGSEEMEMHELLCCVRLMRTDALPEDVRARIRSKINALIGGMGVHDPGTWSAYGLRPLQLVAGPDCPLMPGLEEAIAANIEFEIGAQNADGSWAPNWSWGDAYPQDWEKARLEWAGVLTLEKLLSLHAFGCIDGIEHYTPGATA